MYLSKVSLLRSGNALAGKLSEIPLVDVSAVNENGPRLYDRIADLNVGFLLNGKCKNGSLCKPPFRGVREE